MKLNFIFSHYLILHVSYTFDYSTTIKDDGALWVISYAFLEAVELGLTTYLEKPVKIEQLNQAMLKLSAELEDTSKIPFYQTEGESFFWDKHHRELYRNAALIALTKKEKLLLEMFVTTHHNKLSNEQIYNTVWFEDYSNQNYNESSIKNLINKLRTKLPPKIIKNAYGLGYYLDQLESE